MTLDHIFKPKTVAVIGATNKKDSVGKAIIENMIGFDGIVYPVNPKRKSILGIKAYPSVRKIPDKIDLAVIATPAVLIPAIVKECGEAGIKGVVIISAGFKEAGKKGQKMCSEIMETAKKYKMRIIGPNCLGIIKPDIKLNASFASKMALPGNIAFISQSGALCTAVLDWATSQNVGFSNFISIGSMIDVGFHDLIDYFGQDPNTTAILVYMESLTDARKFLSAARAFSRTKPIIVLKVGKSTEGAKAALSHTGSLAGNDRVFDAAFKRAGIIRVRTIEELFDCAETLAMQPRPSGNRLAVITNAGGPGVISTDFLIENGGKLAELSASTMKELNDFLPEHWSHGNPVDMLGDAMPEVYKKTVEIVAKDPGVDAVLVILTPQSMTYPDQVAKALVELPKSPKTLLTSWMGEEDVQAGVDILEEGRIPCYRTPEDAIKTFMNMYSYSKNLELLYETPGNIPHAFEPKSGANQKIIQNVIKNNRWTLTEAESKEFLKNYGIPTAKYAIAKTADDAIKLSSWIGYPVVMKILSPDILHKTDVGGVKVGIKNDAEARDAFSTIINSAKKHMPKADIQGIFIEEMVSKKYELLIGSKKDPLFGPAIVFGMGGVAVEVFKDTNIGLPPLNMALSMRIIEETKIYELLKGYRGMPGVDMQSIQFLLYKFSYLLQDFPEIKDIDINPFGVDDKGGVVLDAKVILDEKYTKSRPYSHLVISPYPKEFIKDAVLNDGTKVTLRPIRPEDEPLEWEMFTKFSERTQRFRFFQRIKNITHELLIRYTQIDYDREMAIIALVEGKMAGVVRLIADAENETGEFAIVVADPWHKRGLGNLLADYILKIAKQRKIKMIYADFLDDNFIMKHMFESRGFKIEKQDDIYHAELALKN